MTALYLFRNPVLTAVERILGIARITKYVIALASTPVTRGAIFLSLILALLAFWMLTTRRLSPPGAHIATVAVACVLLIVAFHVSETNVLRALPAVLILVTNLVMDQIVDRSARLGELRDRFITVGVGVSELFFCRRYIEWLRSLVGNERIPRRISTGILSVLPGLVLASGAMAAMLDYRPLVPVEQAIRMTPEVSIIDSGDFNWIELDASGRYLYVTGHGLQHLRCYDLAQPSTSPLVSDTPSGGVQGAQGFAYDPQASEIYVYNAESEQLLYFDASTLELERSLPLPGVSPGDPWIAVDRQGNTIAVVSEADVQTGTPLVILDRTTTKVLDQRDFAAGNFLTHPYKPILYLSFFRHRTGLIAYDLEQRKVLGEVSTDSRVDRMAYWEQANEVLLASPVESEVARFDADTLEPKGSLDSIFGVRVLAVDPVRNFLLCGSLATGKVAVYDLGTGQQRASFYLGPWLRTITLDPGGGIAYVSANGALYQLSYGHVR
jgi:DNA-binding beta-propeller fold protein YncE